MKIPRSGKILLAITALFLMNAPIVMAQESTEQINNAVPAEAAEPVNLARTFDADGSPVQMEEAGLAISPPVGWVVRTNTAGMTMIMHEKEKEEKIIDYSKPLFKRNITVTTRHTPMPIDAKTVEEMKAGMTKAMEKSPLAKDFQIIEHKFFDYKGKNDGIILYTQLTLGEFPMMQMHVLVSGAEKHYLLSYTDLANEFQANEAAFQQAWNTMTTIGVIGEAPIRYRDLMVYGGIGGGIFLMLLLLIGLRRRANRRSVERYADSIYEDADSFGDDPMSTSGVWVLDSHAPKSHVSQVNTASSFY